ncbi:MAG: HEAT repeat domain-containing protein [bacterium]|nr:HEAT repeat domain-containing protein [bacterium]
MAQSQVGTKVLIEQLKDANWSIRSKAVEALGESKDASVVDILIEALNDKHPFVRLKSIEALGKITDKKAVQPLVNALKDSNLNNHKAAIEALGEIGDIEAVDILLSEFKSNDSEIKWRAVEALGKIKSSKAMEALISALQDENSDVRSEAAYALGEMKVKSAEDLLINALKDESENVRRDAATALGNVGDSKAVAPLIPLLIDQNSDVSLEAKTALVKIGEPAINLLIDKLNDDKFSDKVIESLILIGNSTIESLRIKLNEKDYSIVKKAVDILIKLKYEPDNINEKLLFMLSKRDWNGCAKMSDEGVLLLINMLNYKNAGVVIEALGEIGDSRAIKPLLSIYDNSTHKEVADALGKIGMEALQPSIIAFRKGILSDEDASRIFIKIGEPAAESLILLLDDENDNVKKTAALALGKIGWVPESIDEKASYYVVKEEWDKCVNLGETAVNLLINKINEKNYRQITIVLLKIGQPAVEELIDSLKKKKPEIRVSVIKILHENSDGLDIDFLINKSKKSRKKEALDKIKSSKDVEALITALQDENSDVRSEAAYMLGEIKDKQTIDFLINVLKDEYENVRIEAAIALGNIGDGKAVEPLISLLTDKNNEVIAEAKNAIVKIGEPAIELLVKKLNDDRFSNKAIELLVNIGNSKAEPLIKKLNDKDYRLREIAADILIKLKYEPKDINEKITILIAKRSWNECVKIGKEAVPQLIKMLNDENRDISIAAIKALSEIGDIRAIQPFLSVYEKSKYMEAIDALVKMGEEAIVPTIKALRENKIEHYNATKIFVKAGKPAVKPLLDLLYSHETYYVNLAALNSLGEIGDISVLEPLLAIFKNSGNRFDNNVLIQAIGNVGANSAVKPPINELKLEPLILALDHEFVSISSDAANALAKLGWVPESIEDKVSYYVAKKEWDKYASLGESAVNIINNKNFKMKIRAVEALGKIGNSWSINYLIDLVKQGDYVFRKKAANALYDINDNKTKDFLISQINHDDSDIRLIAIKLLSEETTNPPIDILITKLKDENINIRKEASNSLIKYGVQSVEKLIIVLDDSDWCIRESAANILGQIKDRRAVQPLIKKIKDEKSQVKSCAVSALGDIGDTSAVQPLIEILKDKNIDNRKLVVDALAKLKWIPSNDEEKAECYLPDTTGIEEAKKMYQQAKILFNDGKYEEAISHEKKVIDILEKYLGANNINSEKITFGSSFIQKRSAAFDLSQILINLADIYFMTGKYKEAEPFYIKAINIYLDKIINGWASSSSLGEKTISMLDNLVFIYEKTGRYQKLEPLYLEYLNIMGLPLGNNNPNIAKYINNLALFYGSTGKHTLAHSNFISAINVRKKNIDNIFIKYSERQKIDYISTVNSEMNCFLSHIAQFQSEDINFVKDGLDIWLQWKGIVTESQSRYEELLSDSNDPKVIIDFNKLIEVKNEIVKLTFSDLGKINDKEYKEKLSVLEKEKENIESRLSTMSKTYALEKRIGKIDSKSIAKMLPKGSYLIEFACPDFYSFTDRKMGDPHYLAFILSSDEGKPVGLIDIGKADNINKLIEEYRTKAKWIVDEEENASNKDVSVNRDIKIEGALKISKNSRDEISKKLYNNIFAPLKDFLGEGKNIFISPEGNLNFIPFEVLISSDGKYLIDEYQFNYITAGRDIMRFNAENDSTNNEIVVMADPDFDLGTDKKEIVLAKLDVGEKENLQFSREMRGVNFGRLSGTREEGEAISKILKEKYEKEPKLFLGDQALEGVLMNNKNPKILHIASHGFFLTDEMMDMLTSSSQDSTRGLSDEEIRNISIIEDKVNKERPSIGNPMLRSGIALAGANTSLNLGRDKGIVVAEKISGLRLRGTELVVLSACDTGVGEVKKGEGVFGLKRAFILAGAKTLVMSLWKVPDEETKDLMIEFYKRMSDGKSKAVALREAKLKIKEKNPNPFYWGGFVSIGNPD